MNTKLRPARGWKRLYADVMKTYNTGYGAILGRFTGVLNLALLASTYLLVKGFELSFTESLFAGIGIVVVILISGFLYLWFGFQKAEASSAFAEQPELMQMKLDIEEIKAIVKKRQGEL